MNGLSSGKAGGDIRPMRFVKQDPDVDNGLLESDANELTIGISYQGTRVAPGTPGDTGLLAAAGDSVGVYGPGAVCKLKTGAAVTRGQRLKSDADGRGVPSATTGTTIQEVGAIALQSAAAANAEILVIVQQYPYRPALS